jgi:hypothetical protein
VAARGSCGLISGRDHSHAINILDLALVIHGRWCCLVSHESGSTSEGASC